jgi:hypothetical protein
MGLCVSRLICLGDLLSTGRGFAVLRGVRSFTFTIFHLPVMIVAEAEFSHRLPMTENCYPTKPSCTWHHR